MRTQINNYRKVLGEETGGNGPKALNAIMIPPSKWRMTSGRLSGNLLRLMGYRLREFQILMKSVVNLLSGPGGCQTADEEIKQE